jgi:hypothetical protein
MRRLLLGLVTILVMLGTNVRSAAADDEWVSPRKQNESSGKYIAAGVTLFGVGYVPAGVVGALSMLDKTFNWMFHGSRDLALGWLAVPGIGPFVYAFNPKPDSAWNVRSHDEIREAQLYSLASGLVQATGLALLTYGVAISPSGVRPPQPMKTTAQITPTATQTSFGLALKLDL